MRIYAVLDLKAGQVVHAVAGERDRYEPVRSNLVPSSEPGDVARAFVERLGIREAYVADLDAIGGRPPDLDSIREIGAAGMRLLLDAGVSHAQQAERLLDKIAQPDELGGLVVPLESTARTSNWPALVKLMSARRAVFSLDLKAGRPLTAAPELAQQTPLKIAQLAWSAGFRRLIALDLQSVGTGQGPSTVKLCRILAHEHAWAELISGGGLRDAADLKLLADAGCHAALMASALHSGEWERK